MLQLGVTSFIIVTAFGMVTIRSIIAIEHCKVFSSSKPYSGRYRPVDGMVSSGLLPYQCRYVCLQSIACKAYNYNATARTWTRFTLPCPLAFTDTVMEFAVFSEKPTNQCYKWVPFSSGDVIDARMISTNDSSRIICRMQRASNDLVCQYNTIYSMCFANFGNSPFDSDGGYPCQRLLIMEDCTVSWVPYIARDPIHHRAVIADPMANGDTVYVTMFDHNRPPLFSLAGHYVEGAAITIGRLGVATQNSTTMMMLIVLWGVKVLLLNVLSHIFYKRKKYFQNDSFLFTYIATRFGMLSLFALGTVLSIATTRGNSTFVDWTFVLWWSNIFVSISWAGYINMKIGAKWSVEWVSNFIPHLTMDVIIFPFWN